MLKSVRADVVVIGTKAMGMRFRMRRGAEAYPGAQKVAVPVPCRVLDVLLRGAYPSVDRMATLL